jgi:hypothetical protein
VGDHFLFLMERGSGSDRTILAGKPWIILLWSGTHTCSTAK